MLSYKDQIRPREIQPYHHHQGKPADHLPLDAAQPAPPTAIPFASNVQPVVTEDIIKPIDERREETNDANEGESSRRSKRTAPFCSWLDPLGCHGNRSLWGLCWAVWWEPPSHPWRSAAVVDAQHDWTVDHPVLLAVVPPFSPRPQHVSRKTVCPGTNRFPSTHSKPTNTGFIVSKERNRQNFLPLITTAFASPSVAPKASTVERFPRTAPIISTVFATTLPTLRVYCGTVTTSTSIQ